MLVNVHLQVLKAGKSLSLELGIFSFPAFACFFLSCDLKV